MHFDSHPTAADSYARTLKERGCPPLLAARVGQLLERLDGATPTPEEQALIDRAYAHLNQ